MKSGETWYEILEIPVEASAEEIRLAYFEQARQYHPDTNPSELAREWFFQIQQSYEVLSNPDSRKQYDQSLKGRKKNKDLVQLSLMSSANSIPKLDEEQLLYVLLELKSIGEIEKAKLPLGHLCIVVDCSTSMKGGRIEMVKENILRLMGSLKSEDTFSIISFNDRAEIILTPTKVQDVQALDEKLSKISCFGGTEIYMGLKAGFDLLWSGFTNNVIKHMILLTDGHTYGDEEACIELSKKMQARGITLSALGIGHEWNDIFLDKLAGITGGHSEFISNTDDLKDLMNHLSGMIFTVAAENVSLDLYSQEGAKLNSIYRLQPNIAELSLEKPISLGEIYKNKSSTYLLTFSIPALMEQESVIIAKGKVRYTPINSQTGMKLFINLCLPIEGSEPNQEPPKEIIKALSAITIYQMQQKANNDVRTGHIDQAINRLGHISTQLLRLGEPKLARKAREEAETLQKQKTYSPDGDKQLKYGTRSLIASVFEKRES